MKIDTFDGFGDKKEEQGFFDKIRAQLRMEQDEAGDAYFWRNRLVPTVDKGMQRCEALGILNRDMARRSGLTFRRMRSRKLGFAPGKKGLS